MHGPASPGWLLVALCAATGSYCLLRMRSSVEQQRVAAGGEAVMGFGMAAMAVPAAVFAPPAWAWPAYAVVFGGAALRALASARTSPHHLHHLVGTAAMVYMAVAMSVSSASSPAGHHHGATGVPLVTGALLAYFTGYVLLAGVRLAPAGPASVSSASSASSPSPVPAGPSVASGGTGWGDRPELARACRVSMGISMVAMLLTL
ncbi:DUF5134 domain-containing protein [Streptomyces sp. NPDC008150]|uniref:DUF5134 domain-containing protein n=1 Tax=Streptomyces sp. NPDC008150 TaxID=3364816 RepID=UPI0036EEA1B8